MSTHGLVLEAHELPISELWDAESPPGNKSVYYEKFPTPIRANGGFDFHIYYQQNNEEQVTHAKTLHERIRREFPELPVYTRWDRALGAHPTAMFEVNVFDPHQIGALFTFLVVNRGPCSVLIHPNTDDPYRDHTQSATWMGEKWPLNTEMLKKAHGQSLTCPW